MFPPDLPDLLRLACRQGRMRLNTVFSAANGHQANLARSGQGWTVDSDPDPLVAIEKVLRAQFGSMLERERAEASSHPGIEACRATHETGSFRGITGDPLQIDIEEAIAAAGDDDIAGLIG